MSIQIMSAIWKKKIRGVDKLVLLSLAAYADDDGNNVVPTVAMISEECGICRWTAQCKLRQFVKDGILVIAGRVGGGRGPRRYSMVLDQIKKTYGDCTHVNKMPTLPLLTADTIGT